MQSIYLDYGIMEKFGGVVLTIGDFGWYDVGSWDCLGVIFPSDEKGNVVRGNILNDSTIESL
jgi:mannose-1-phosphate guanylyltransferase